MDGAECVVDEGDRYVAQYSWRNQGGSVRRKHGATSQSLARVILGLSVADTRVVDHINGDPLDNRRENLRIGSLPENNRNRGKTPGKFSSEYKGVSRQGRGWQAHIQADGKRRRLGSFQSEEDAAKAYDAAALASWGDWSRLNFPVVSNPAPSRKRPAAVR